MIEYSTYEKATGKIIMMWAAPSEDFATENNDIGYVLGRFEPSSHYVLDGEVTPRPASPVTRTDLTLLAIPEGSTLWLNEVSYAVEGEVELEFPLPGVYKLRVECFPYLDWSDEVTV